MINYTITGRLLDYSDFRRYDNIFVETGSAAGDGIQRALDAGFTEVHSIEAALAWYEMCIRRFEGNEKVDLHLGKSTDVLEVLDFPVQTVFFLDAHPSGPLSAGHDDVMVNGSKSEFNQDSVIKAELNIIFSKFIMPIIIIDDQNAVTADSLFYIEMLNDFDQNYLIEFYDENLGGDHFYRNKLLVARYE